MYYVYILQNEIKKQIYLGSTNDLRKRFKEHNEGKVTSTKRYKPWTLFYYEAYKTEKLARLREKALKYHGNAMKELKKRIGLKEDGGVLPSTTFNAIESGAGFTLIELLVSVSIFIIILSGSWISYLNWQRSQNLVSYSGQIISLINQAQQQAISRTCTENCDSATSGENFGIYFDSVENKVILFRGLVYNPEDSYNYAMELPSVLQLSLDLPVDKSITFSKITGEVHNFDANNHEFILSESGAGNSNTFNINRLGIIDVN